MTTDAATKPRQTGRAPARLRRRADFVRATKTGVKVSCPSFSVQMAECGEDAEGAPRFGLTVTRKVAGAVGRNRIRRRLREALRLGGAANARPGKDYVFVARQAALAAPFHDIIRQMADGLRRLDARRFEPNRRNPKSRP